MLKRIVFAAAMLASACTTLDEQKEGSNSFDFLLHSDLPLWIDYQDPAISPRHFSDGDSFGCLSALPFGDWKLSYDASGFYSPPPIWWRVMNYGVIHCGALFGSSAERGDNTDFRPGFAVDLGVDPATGLELWVWEIGLRPGSDYLVLARPKDGDRGHFLVLDPDCAAGQIREVGAMLSTWRTEYCNVPSQQAMRTIARKAAAKPAIGKLELVGDIPVSER